LNDKVDGLNVKVDELKGNVAGLKGDATDLKYKYVLISYVLSSSKLILLISQQLLPMQLANTAAGECAPLLGPDGRPLAHPTPLTCRELVNFTGMFHLSHDL
jgi:hypothetical protein